MVDRRQEYLSTGVDEIDQQHQEIEDLLDTAIASDHPADYLSGVMGLIRGHLKNEVELARKQGLRLTDTHLADHLRLEQLLDVIKQSWQRETARDDLERIRSLLHAHTVAYDKKLKG